MNSMRLLLRIDDRVKGVPYGPVRRSDSENHGFRSLKGKTDEVESIAEAKDNQKIVAILKSINSNESPFFSVGCEKSFNKSKTGFWAKGYIEFAFNYKELVSDAVQYFPLFFHFNRHAEQFVKSHDVQFLWELQPAHFGEIGANGFTCCVWITTGNVGSARAAKELWESAVEVLDSYLSTLGTPANGTQIYAGGP